MSVKLVEVTRGKIVESTHRGSLVVADSNGSILYELGKADRTTFFRSSGKPLQVLASLEAGIAERYGLDLKEIAIMLSSHSGEKEHLDILHSIMEKTGFDEDDLACGAHDPHSKAVTKELYAAGKAPTKLHCNCSGKHLAMLAAIKAKSMDISGYYKLEHEYQENIIKTIARFCNVEESEVVKGVDGCGAPVYAVPLKNMALAYANLCDAGFHGGRYGKSQNYILSAMALYPEMVAGKGRFDTEIMRHFGDRLISKMGAEGVYCAGILRKSIGVALKIEDGSSRAVEPAAVEVLLQMGIINEEEAGLLRDFWKPDILNHKGEKVGKIRPVFKL